MYEPKMGRRSNVELERPTAPCHQQLRARSEVQAEEHGRHTVMVNLRAKVHICELMRIVTTGKLFQGRFCKILNSLCHIATPMPLCP